MEGRLSLEFRAPLVQKNLLLRNFAGIEGVHRPTAADGQHYAREKIQWSRWGFLGTRNCYVDPKTDSGPRGSR